MEYEVERVEVAAQPTAVVRGVVATDGVAEFLGGAFGEVMATLGAQGLHPAGMPFGCYLPVDGGLEIEAGFPASGPVQPTGRVIASALPEGPAVVVHYRGAYDQVPAAYAAAETWMAENGWEATGPPWEAYLDGPEVPEPRTDVFYPARAANA